MISGTSASPPTIQSTGIESSGARLPSTTTRAGRIGRRATARRIARRLARNTSSSSISAVDAAPIPIQAASASSRARRSRRLAVSVLESARPSTGRRSTTAAASTGPASGPRPTSSTPAIGPAALTIRPRADRKPGGSDRLPGRHEAARSGRRNRRERRPLWPGRWSEGLRPVAARARRSQRQARTVERGRLAVSAVSPHHHRSPSTRAPHPP